MSAVDGTQHATRALVSAYDHERGVAWVDSASGSDKSRTFSDDQEEGDDLYPYEEEGMHALSSLSSKSLLSKRKDSLSSSRKNKASSSSRGNDNNVHVGTLSSSIFSGDNSDNSFSSAHHRRHRRKQSKGEEAGEEIGEDDEEDEEEEEEETWPTMPVEDVVDRLVFTCPKCGRR